MPLAPVQVLTIRICLPLYFCFNALFRIRDTEKAMSFFEEKNGCVVLRVRVVPRAAKDSIQGLLGDALKVRIQAPPIDGRANAYLIRFLSKQWDIPRSNIEILSGDTGRNKRIRISNPSNSLRALLSSIANE